MEGIDVKASSSRGFGVLVVAAWALVACGGGGGGSSEAGDDVSTTFGAYPQNPTDGATGTAQRPLSAVDAAEVASRSRLWAADTLVTRDVFFPANAVSLPPVYFARLQAVASAASGATMAELRADAPIPSTAAATAALMRGIARTVSAGADSRVTTAFMRSLTAADDPGTWASLRLTALSEAAAAAQRDLRLTVSDEFQVGLPWQQATVFDGVFEAQSGWRVNTPMLRLVGPLRTIVDSEMQATALAANGHWLVRIVPVRPISAWTADDLAAALAKVTSALPGAFTTAAEGELVLPLLSGIRAVGTADGRGLQSAQDPVRADLRALDGVGGTYVSLPTASASLVIAAQGLSIAGYSSTYFVYSTTNLFSSGGVTGLVNLPFRVSCGETTLRPGYLALIDDVGRIEMLARYTSLDGRPCF